MKSKDHRKWVLPPGAAQANQAMMEYVLDRSIALLLIERPDYVHIASSICVRIEDRYLLATAAHNVEAISSVNQIRLLPRGRRGNGDAAIVKFRGSGTHDVAFLEVSRDYIAGMKMRHLELPDLKLGQRHDLNTAFLICGFPSQEATVHSVEDIEPVPLGLLTSSVDGGEGTDRLILQYPPQSPLDKGLELVEPHGLSGCGIWSYPPFETNPVWMPSSSRLVGIASSWNRARRCEIAEPIEYWLAFLANELPDLRGVVGEYLKRP